MSKDNFITKEKANILYGVGIILMVFHHLFAFPERINVPYDMMFDFSFIHIETIISYFGKVCVALYAFLSGYALTLRVKDNITFKELYNMCFKQLKKFYITYLIIILVFIPMGIIIGKYEFNIIELLNNMIGISCSYNAEWWYVKQYVLMILLYPVIVYSLIKIDKSKLRRFKYIVYALAYVGSILYLTCFDQSVFYAYLMCFITGCIVCFEGVFNIINKYKLNRLWSIFILLFIFVIRTLYLGSNLYDFIIIVPFVYSLINVLELKVIKSLVSKILMILGKHSKYIYYIHTFFIYYYFQSFTYLPRHSLLILVWCLLLCFCVSMLLRYIDMGFNKRINI